jgi:hypothetical protein
VNLLNVSEVNIIESVFDAYEMDGDGEEVGMVMLRMTLKRLRRRCSIQLNHRGRNSCEQQ